jgi:hypothetical protein
MMEMLSTLNEITETEIALDILDYRRIANLLSR